jgi:hypothetical protein
VTVIGFKNSQAGVEQVSFRHDDDVEAWRSPVTTENLSYQSFSTISPDGATQLASGCDPEPAHVEVVGQDEDRAVAAVDADSVLVRSLEVGSAPNPFTRPKSKLVTGTPALYSLLTVRRLRPLARRRLST